MDAQWNLKCPNCGTIDEKAWTYWACSKDKVPYYIDGKSNHQCKCGNNKKPIVALCDPEFLCMSGMQYSRVST